MKRTTIACAAAILAQSAVSPLVAQSAADAPLSLTLGTIRTEAEAAAVGFTMELAKGLQEIFTVGAGSSCCWLFQASPSVQIQAGDQDAFNGVVVKLGGHYVQFDTVHVSNVPTPKADGFFWAVPISIGMESNRKFDIVNALAEIGWIPWYQNIRTLGPVRRTQFGVFLQGGYKFDLSADELPTDRDVAGGAADESDEDPSSALFRAMANGRVAIPVETLGLPFEVMGDGTGWYDIANGAFYHKIAGVLRLTVIQGRHFDLKWENGSGAPNFNKGQQFSANITVEF